MLQNGSMMMPGGHLAHAELQQQHVAVAALAHEALAPPKTLTPRRALQERVVARPRSRWGREAGLRSTKSMYRA